MGDEERIGILAYGSLIEDPGVELAPLIVDRVLDVQTPFRVELLRSSRSRDGAPTVVPDRTRGATVGAVILVLDEAVDVDTARDLLWRRETRTEGSGRHYREAAIPSTDRVSIVTLHGLGGIATVLYTSIGANIADPTPANLARLAIGSTAGKAGLTGRDGISYLISLRAQGIETPLMARYEAEILDASGASSLEGALAWARALATDGAP